MKKIMTSQGDRLKMLLVSKNPDERVITFVRVQASFVKTSVISEKDALQVILSICYRNKIGYDLEGIKAVFKAYPNFDLTAMLDLIQKVFVQTHYCSKENVCKVSGIPAELPKVGYIQAILPLERCTICTLIPPCLHRTLESLQEAGFNRRKELPRNKASVVCTDFVRHGYCSSFNKFGRCGLDHPKGCHILEKPVHRCEQCTIPWPCNHCAYSSARDSLVEVVEEIKKRISRLRQINVPDPPLSLTKHLVSLFLELFLGM